MKGAPVSCHVGWREGNFPRAPYKISILQPLETGCFFNTKMKKWTPPCTSCNVQALSFLGLSNLGLLSTAGFDTPLKTAVKKSNPCFSSASVTRSGLWTPWGVAFHASGSLLPDPCECAPFARPQLFRGPSGLVESQISSCGKAAIFFPPGFSGKLRQMELPPEAPNIRPFFSWYHVNPLLKKEVLPWKTDRFSQNIP